MRLIVMTAPTFFVEEDEILTALFDAGLDDLHLRKTGATRTWTERLLTLLDEDYRSRVTIHGMPYLKAEYGLRGIHLLAGEDVPEGYRGRVTCSCTTTNGLREAKRRSDYVFLEGAFGGSFTKQALEEAAHDGAIDRKVYACGGVNEESIMAARDIGFGGVVLSDDLWQRFDIHSAQDYRQLIAHYERLRHLC